MHRMIRLGLGIPVRAELDGSRIRMAIKQSGAGLSSARHLHHCLKLRVCVVQSFPSLLTFTPNNFLDFFRDFEEIS